MRKAKLFLNGGSQAVRLPADFRFEGDSVYIRRDERTGDVILSSRPRLSWQEFMAIRDSVGGEDLEIPRRELEAEPRDPFADWVE